MKRGPFKLWHSLLGIGALLLLEHLLLAALPGESVWLILLVALLGALGISYVATEVIEEVKNAERMLTTLSAVVAEFILFFTLQYWFLLLVEPASFPSLPVDAVSILLHTVMIFVFNPIHLPATLAGRALLLVNTLGALALVLFILQNIAQFKRIGKDKPL